MNEFEKQLTDISKGMDYPPTPDIAGFVSTRLRPARSPRFMSKTWAWSLTIVLILLLSLLLIPPARAAILEFIQIGIVRIFPQPVEATVEPVDTTEPETILPATATPVSSLLPFLESIAGDTTLESAQERVFYPILLPAYPVDIGEPDHVYVQNAEGNMTILIWLDEQNPDDVAMSLHFIPAGSWAVEKSAPQVIQETVVNGQRAVWAVGLYPFRMSDGDLQVTRLIEGHVLIWEEDGVTYRLETDLSLEETIQIAESLTSP